MSVNVFGYEEKDIIPLRITKQSNRLHHINLLMLHEENRSHYCLITNFNNFLKHVNQSTNFNHYCPYCLHGFTYERLLQEHILYCQVHGEQKMELPTKEDCFLEFKDFEKSLRVPYVIYADFETLNKPLDTTSQLRSTIQTQLLEPCSFGYKVESTDPNFSKDTVLYRGVDAPKKLIECLMREAQTIEEQFNDIKPLNLTSSEENTFHLA